MSYRIQIRPLVTRQIASWQLPDPILVEVYLRLNVDLTEKPTRVLFSSDEAGGGMVFPFSVIDPDNRLCKHTFAFRVYYATDEITLRVTSGLYRKQVGF
jgi:hypothetical protein